MNQRASQEKQILDFLLAGNKLTALDGLTLFNCMRVGARIFNLKKQGHPIESRLIETPSGKRISQYFISPKETLFEL